MDESFQLRAKRLLDGRRDAAPLDHDMLSAALAAQRTASPTASAQARAGGKAAGSPQRDPLTELLLGGSGWKAAASVQSGCFNRAESERRRNAP
ncbi:MAG TPA: hypothetical protein VLK25_06005 [Allosphingosinicella sp.]|nr:hypothetical protein [Allosphingosinicella sp.]